MACEPSPGQIARKWGTSGNFTRGPCKTVIMSARGRHGGIVSVVPTLPHLVLPSTIG